MTQKNKKRFKALPTLLLLVAIGFLALGCQGKNGPVNTTINDNLNTADGNTTTNTAPMSVTVTISAQNDSAESGTAVLESKGNQTKVTLQLGNTTNTPQPAHIHTGACPNPGAVKYPLSNVISGYSETVLNVSLTDLLGQLPLAINVHKSATEISQYVACGDVVSQ